MAKPFQIIAWAWIALLAIWLASSMFNKRTLRRQSGALRLQQLGLGLIGGLLIYWGGPDLVPRTLESGWIGLALVLAGILIALWARRSLGRNWSATPAIKHGHELVRTGPYKVVRHPIYSGFLLAILGTVIANGTLGAFAGLVVIAIALRWKSVTEEHFMTEQFGPQYAEYRRGTRALVPFIW